MTPKEARQEWATEKEALLLQWASKSREEREKLVVEATTYRSGSDSCNSVYMGSLQAHMLYEALPRGYPTWEKAVSEASDAQLEEALSVCADIIKCMIEHPIVSCPCCGQETTTLVVQEYQAALERPEAALTDDLNFLEDLATRLINKNSGKFTCAWTDYGQKLLAIVNTHRSHGSDNHNS